MNIAIAQTRYKTGDFEFNLNSIKEKVLKTDAELVIFPEADLYEIGGKDLLLDKKVQDAQDYTITITGNEQMGYKGTVTGAFTVAKDELTIKVNTVT